MANCLIHARWAFSLKMNFKRPQFSIDEQFNSLRLARRSWHAGASAATVPVSLLTGLLKVCRRGERAHVRAALPDTGEVMSHSMPAERNRSATLLSCRNECMTEVDTKFTLKYSIHVVGVRSNQRDSNSAMVRPAIGRVLARKYAEDV